MTPLRIALKFDSRVCAATMIATHGIPSERHGSFEYHPRLLHPSYPPNVLFGLILVLESREIDLLCRKSSFFSSVIRSAEPWVKAQIDPWKLILQGSQF